MKSLKIFTLLSLFCSFSFILNAQVIEKGYFTAGLNFTTSLDEGGVKPGVAFGYTVSDNLVIGTELLGSLSGDDTSTFGFQPYGRYYFSNFFGQLGLNYSRVKVSGASTSNTDISLGAGYAFSYGDSALIEPYLKILPGDVMVISMGVGVTLLLE